MPVVPLGDYRGYIFIILIYIIIYIYRVIFGYLR